MSIHAVESILYSPLVGSYRFVLNAAQTYLKNLYEPDLIVEWENIEQISMFSSTPYKCPICWDPPRAAYVLVLNF